MTPDPDGSIQGNTLPARKTHAVPCRIERLRAAGRRRTGCVQPRHPAAARRILHACAFCWTCILSPATKWNAPAGFRGRGVGYCL